MSDKVRITCQGGSWSTRVFINDQEVPQRIIQSVTFDAQVQGDPPVVHLELLGTDLEITAEMTVVPIIRPMPGYKIVQQMAADRVVFRSVPDIDEESDGSQSTTPAV